MFAFTSPLASRTMFMNSCNSTLLWQWWYKQLQRLDTCCPPCSVRRQQQWLVSHSSISRWLSQQAIWLIWKASSTSHRRNILHGPCTSRRCTTPSQEWWLPNSQLKVIRVRRTYLTNMASKKIITGVAWQCWPYLPFFNVFSWLSVLYCKTSSLILDQAIRATKISFQEVKNVSRRRSPKTIWTTTELDIISSLINY